MEPAGEVQHTCCDQRGRLMHAGCFKGLASASPPLNAPVCLPFPPPHSTVRCPAASSPPSPRPPSPTLPLVSRPLFWPRRRAVPLARLARHAAHLCASPLHPIPIPCSGEYWSQTDNFMQTGDMSTPKVGGRLALMRWWEPGGRSASCAAHTSTAIPAPWPGPLADLELSADRQDGAGLVVWRPHGQRLQPRLLLCIRLLLWWVASWVGAVQRHC